MKKNDASRKALRIIGSIRVAIALWIYVDTVTSPEVTLKVKNVPVEFSGEDTTLADRGLMLLSGYASPVDGMPHWLQLVAAIDPLSHMLTISHGLFLKGLPAEAIMPQILPILAVAVAALAVALGLMRLRHD